MPCSLLITLTSSPSPSHHHPHTRRYRYRTSSIRWPCSRGVRIPPSSSAPRCQRWQPRHAGRSRRRRPHAVLVSHNPSIPLPLRTLPCNSLCSSASVPTASPLPPLNLRSIGNSPLPSPLQKHTQQPPKRTLENSTFFLIFYQCPPPRVALPPLLHLHHPPLQHHLSTTSLLPLLPPPLPRMEEAPMEEAPEPPRAQRLLATCSPPRPSAQRNPANQV